MRQKLLVAVLIALMALSSCTPKQPVEFRDVQDIALTNSNPAQLTGEAVFYNPNRAHGKLRSVKISIFVNDKLAGSIDEQPNMSIKGMSEFTVPLTVELEMDKVGLLDAVMGVLGAKKFDVHFTGHIRVSYGSVPFSVPVDYSKEVKLKF